MITKLKILVVGLVALAVGCATNNDLLDRENAAVGATTKIITPNEPEQEALPSEAAHGQSHADQLWRKILLRPA